MKRIFTTAVLSMAMTCAVTATAAEMDNAVSVDTVSIEAYRLDYNVSSLARTLRLSDWQVHTVAGMKRDYQRSLKAASRAEGSERKAILDEALRNDMRNMSRILTAKQFKKYQTLVNLTLANRAIIR